MVLVACLSLGVATTAQAQSARNKAHRPAAKPKAAKPKPLPPPTQRSRLLTPVGERLPSAVEAMLAGTAIDRANIAFMVQAVGAEPGQPGHRVAAQPAVRLSLNASRPMNPASLEKLLTTQAALDLLGPAWTWQTPVWMDGQRAAPSPESVADQPHTWQGNLTMQGSGDPKLNVERLWLLMTRLQQLGVRHIQGDWVLDQSGFDIADVHPGAFDNEPLRAYNVRPQALLLNQKSLLVHFTAQAPASTIVSLVPALDGVNVTPVVPSLNGDTPCGDWRARLAAQWGDPTRISFDGAFAVSCGPKAWPIAYADPASYHERLIRAMWGALGGSLKGRVIESKERRKPAAAPDTPWLQFESPPLAEIVRDINKFSNNTMAQQLFLSLSLHKKGVGTWDGSRELMRQWLQDTVNAPMDGIVVDNGAGLSRDSRVTARALAQLLQHAWRQPTMPDLMASLPASGVDGTLRRSQAGAGRAHLKTGSLRDVAAVAGYVLGESGQRYVLVALVNQDGVHTQARRLFDELIAWTAADQTPP